MRSAFSGSRSKNFGGDIMQKINAELGCDEDLKLINICNHTIITNYKTIVDPTAFIISNSKSSKMIIEIRNRPKQCIVK